MISITDDTAMLGYAYGPPMICSLSVESLYDIIMTNDDNVENKSNNSNGDDIKWLHYDVHLQCPIPAVQFYSVIMIYDRDSDRIIITGGESNVATNWNDLQSRCISRNAGNTPTDTSLLHSLTPMPTPRNGMMHKLLSTHEYVIVGGNRLVSSDTDSNNKVEVYNMRTNKWSSLPDLIDERGVRDAACGVDPRNGRIYIFGGGTHENLCLKAYNTVDYYDPITNKWNTLSVKMRRKRYGPAAIWLPTINSFLITGGHPSCHGESLEYDEDDYDPIDGHLYEYEECQSMEIYSPDTNTFTLLPSSWSIPDSLGVHNHHLHLIDDCFLIIMCHSPDEDRPGQYPRLSRFLLFSPGFGASGY
jgi:hypothetical protein